MNRRAFNNWLYGAGIAALLVGTLFPIYWMVVTTFKRRGEFFTLPVIFTPRHLNLRAYAEALTAGGAHSLIDSLIIASSTMILSVALGLFAAYAVARLGTGGRNTMYWLLAIQMMPPVAMALPLFLLFRHLHMLDTFPALILSDTVFNLPYTIWLMNGFFSELPRDIEEAALIDGCSTFGVFWRVALPLVRSGLVVVAFFTFIFAWNEFLLAFSFSRTHVTPVTVVIPTLEASDSIAWEQVSALAVMAAIPPVLLVLFLQRFLVRGLSMGAVKG